MRTPICWKAAMVFKLSSPCKKPDTSEYEIVYAIMRRPYADGSMSIPFFSKVSVHSSLEQLQNMGFKVAIDLVEKLEPVAVAA